MNVQDTDMITPELERLILSGKAQYKTFTCAVGGVTTIPVPDKNYIVITDFIWTGFFDAPIYQQAGPPLDEQTFKRRNTKQMQLRSGKENASYIFRDDFNLQWTFEPFGVKKRMSPKLNPIRRVDCFFKFTDNVNVDITIMPDCDTNWVMDNFSPMPDNSGENQQPNGYGTVGFAGFNTARRLTIAGGTIYDPPGFIRNKLGVLPRSTGEFHTDYLAGFQLKNPLAFFNPLHNNASFPIITFGFVQVNEVTLN